MNITFNDLPQAISQLYIKLDNIERLLHEKGNNLNPNEDRWFDLNELCNYLPDKPAKATVYGWVQDGLLPHHKGQKKLRFLKSEIDHWLMGSKIKTHNEILEEVHSYMAVPKKRRVHHD